MKIFGIVYLLKIRLLELNMIKYKNGFLYYINNGKLYKLLFSSLKNARSLEIVVDTTFNCHLKSLFISNNNIIWIALYNGGVLRYNI